MSNIISTSYFLKETDVPENKTNTIQIPYVGQNPQFKGTQLNDTFESSENKKKGKALWITLLSLTGLTALVLSLLARKGGKTLGKDAKISEKIKQGWKEFWGKDKNIKDSKNTNNRPKSNDGKPLKAETVNRETNKLELSQSDKEAAERIKNGYLLPEPQKLPPIDAKEAATYEQQFSKSQEYKNNISYVEGQIKAEIESKTLKEKAEAEAKAKAEAAKKQQQHEKMFQQRKLRQQMKAKKAIREEARKAKEAEEARKQQMHEKMLRQRSLRKKIKTEKSIKSQELKEIEEQQFAEKVEVAQKATAAEKEYIKFWEKSMDVVDKKEDFINWFKEDKRLMDYFKLTDADLNRVICDGNSFKITKENGLSIRYYPDGIRIRKPMKQNSSYFYTIVDTEQTGCFAVGKESLLDKLDEKTAGMHSHFRRSTMIDSYKELNGICFIKFFDDAMISLRPNKNKIIRTNKGAMIYIDAEGNAKMFADGKESHIRSEGSRIFNFAFNRAIAYPTEMKGHSKYSFKDSIELTEERIGDIGGKIGSGKPPLQTVAVLTPEAKQKHIDNMIEWYVEMHPQDGFQKCSKDCVVYRDGIKENIHIVYEGDLYDIDSSGRLLQKVKVHRRIPDTFERQIDIVAGEIAESENAFRPNGLTQRQSWEMARNQQYRIQRMY